MLLTMINKLIIPICFSILFPMTTLLQLGVYNKRQKELNTAWGSTIELYTVFIINYLNLLLDLTCLRMLLWHSLQMAVVYWFIT